MNDESWIDRLERARRDAKMSQRAVSLAAGRASGYFNSLIKDGKTPSTENLLAVCKAIGVSPTYILYGENVMPEDAEVISAMREDPEVRSAILAILRRRRSDAHSQ